MTNDSRIGKMDYKLCLCLWCCISAACLASQQQQFTGYLNNVQIDKHNGDIYLATKYSDKSYLYKVNSDLENRKVTALDGDVMSVVIDYVRDALVVCVDGGLCTHYDARTLSGKGPALQGAFCADSDGFYLGNDRYCPFGQRVTAFLAGETHSNLFMAGDAQIKKCPSQVDQGGQSSAVYQPGPSSQVLGDAFVYGFNHNGYGYSVGSFRVSGQAAAEKEVRISRVCDEDTDRQSYAEVPLRCDCSAILEYSGGISDAAIQRSRQRINWAHLAKTSVAMATALNVSDEEDVLYFVTQSRCLCGVTMPDVEKSFADSITSCMSGKTPVPETETFQCPSSIYASTSQQLCTGPNSPPGQELVVAKAMRVLKRNVKIASMMTSGGHSILVYSDGDNSRYVDHQVDTMLPITALETVDEEPSSNCNGATEMEFRLQPDNTHILSLGRSQDSSKSVITKEVLWDCSEFRTCSQCLESDNTLCGWCAQENACTLEPLCKSAMWIQALANDQMDGDAQQLCAFPGDFGSADHTLKFDPTSTLLTPTLNFCGAISPNPLESFKAGQTSLISVSVFVDDVPCNNVQYPADGCQVDGVTPDSFSFSCTLESQKRELDGPVYGQFLLAVGSSYVRMRVTSSENFNWRVPTIESLTPTRGPESGGTVVTITGTDLNFRPNMHITIGDQTCQPFGTPTVSSLQCETTSVQLPVDPSIVSITYNDGEYTAESDDKFTYTEDPTVTFIGPKRIFLGGGLLHVVGGTNFDTVVEPKFTVAMRENNIYVDEWTSTCQVESPTSMLCPTPHIDLPADIDVDFDDGECGLITVTTSGADGEFRLGFTFDGVQQWLPSNIGERLDNVMTVARNPVFNVFDGDILTIEPMDNITITGKRLDCGYQMKDIQIKVGDGFCDILFINHTLLVCEPLYVNTTLRLHRVQVLVGSSEDVAMVYDVGYMEYQEPITTTEERPSTVAPTTTTKQPVATTPKVDGTTAKGIVPTSKTEAIASSYQSSTPTLDQTISPRTNGYAAQTETSFWTAQMIAIVAACGALMVLVVVLIIIACVVIRRKRVNHNDNAAHHNNNPKEGAPHPDKYGVTYVPNDESSEKGNVYFLPQKQGKNFDVVKET